MGNEAGAVVLVAFIVGGVVLIVQTLMNGALAYLAITRGNRPPQTAGSTTSASSKTVTVKPAFHTGTGPARVPEATK